jgi:hypothetical protein
MVAEELENSLRLHGIWLDTIVESSASGRGWNMGDHEWPLLIEKL